MKYFVPSKTFLTGEYSVLVGGAALGLATAPCFEISYLETKSTFQFHPESAAGRLQKKIGQNDHVHFLDPYLSKGLLGGFGKSTAEYFAVLIPELKKKKQSIQQIRRQYIELHASEGVKPSGIDLVFQYLGRVTWADPASDRFESLGWKFPELDFFIISTGLKVKTHEHLAGLNLSLLAELPFVSDQVIDSYQHKTSDYFLKDLQEWSTTLMMLGLTHKSSIEMKNELQKIDEIRLVKPCGALGADVMLVFFDAQNRKSVEQILRDRNIKIQASRQNLVEGLISDVD